MGLGPETTLATRDALVPAGHAFCHGRPCLRWSCASPCGRPPLCPGVRWAAPHTRQVFLSPCFRASGPEQGKQLDRSPRFLRWHPATFEFSPFHRNLEGGAPVDAPVPRKPAPPGWSVLAGGGDSPCAQKTSEVSLRRRQRSHLVWCGSGLSVSAWIWGERAAEGSWQEALSRDWVVPSVHRE